MEEVKDHLLDKFLRADDDFSALFLCYNPAPAPKAPHILPGTGIERP
jgi:hypothetical protein